MNIKLWYYNKFYKGKRIEDLQKQSEKEDEIKFKKKIQDFIKSGVAPEYVEQLILSRCSEGKNIDEKGNEFWVCSHCTNHIKFKTREEYVAHHQRIHS